MADFINKSDSGVVSDVIYKTGLFAYYTCWVFGAKFDVDIEERVYIRDSLGGILDWKAFGVIVILTAVMIVFFGLHQFGYERLFPIGLAAFVGANYLGWLTVCKRIAGPIADSDRHYKHLGDYFGSVKVRTVEAYMCGHWQTGRFITMAVMALVLIVAANAIPYYGIVSRYAGVELKLGIKSEKLVPLFPAIMFVFYVIAAEAWMWIKRANVYVCIGLIDRLSKDYRLELRGKG